MSDNPAADQLQVIDQTAYMHLLLPGPVASVPTRRQGSARARIAEAADRLAHVRGMLPSISRAARILRSDILAAAPAKDFPDRMDTARMRSGRSLAMAQMQELTTEKIRLVTTVTTIDHEKHVAESVVTREEALEVNDLLTRIGELKHLRVEDEHHTIFFNPQHIVAVKVELFDED